LQGLPEPNRTLSLTIFTNYIKNPYWGMPLSGPSHPTGCQVTTYKPNNFQFAKQGAVDSSTRNLKLNVDTISTNSAAIHNKNSFVNYEKNKVPNCNSPTVFQFQNKKLCYFKSLPQYQNPVSKPGTYRYYPTSVSNSNHFSQSPNTYNTTTGSAAYK
jgi:hypothetical protein